MPTSVRLDPATEKLLKRLVRRSGLSKSEVIRRAIESLARGEDETIAAPGPFEKVEHLLGIVDLGDPSLSEQTGHRFYEDLVRRRGGE